MTSKTPPNKPKPAKNKPAKNKLAKADSGAKKRAAAKLEKDRLERAKAQQLAQIVNLHIAGYSLSQIGAQTGYTAQEIDDMLARDAARYVRSQPALRVYVRNWISERYQKMIEADWETAVDKQSPARLENQDRVIRLLNQMSKLHGAEAPVQTEVKIETAPEDVDKMVQRLSAAQGMGYDMAVFDDIVDAEVVSEGDVPEAEARTLDSSERVGETQDGEDPEQF